MRTKILLFICLLILFCGVGVNVSARNKEIRITIPELNLNWANYENKIVRIEFDHATSISQLDKKFYRANIWDKEMNNIYVEFKKAGLKYMQRANKYKRKWRVYAIVVKTTLQNTYGATSAGPKLKLIGSRRISGGVRIRYKW